MGAPRWQKVLEPDELADGKVRQVKIGEKKYCLVHFEGKYAALNNECLHQGTPLGKGKIENGRLICPLHFWEFDPLTGNLIGYDHGVGSHPVEVRPDGIYVDVDPEAADGSEANPWTE